MMITTVEHGSIAFVIETLSGKFCGFQILLSGQVVGDDSPSILGTAISELKRVASAPAEQQDLHSLAAEELVGAVFQDDRLHDVSVLHLSESLDDWLLIAVPSEHEVRLIARKDRDPTRRLYEGRTSRADFLRMCHVMEAAWHTMCQTS